MELTKTIKKDAINALKEDLGVEIPENMLMVQKTRKEFKGDFTINVFPFLKLIKKSPEAIGEYLGAKFVAESNYIVDYNIVKGFLNLTVEPKFWIAHIFKDLELPRNNGENIMVEFSSPNTNKPLHLGHIRNNLLGDSISRVLTAAGYKVNKVNLVNDRGIHICKSMLAWEKWGDGITPDEAKKKGDQLVGDFYVLFDKKYKEEIEKLTNAGKSIDEAKDSAAVIQEAKELLRKWEQGDKDVIELWQKMNTWVYNGFEETYKRLGITFDKVYYESNTYKLGKKLVIDGLDNNILVKKEDGSVWADLTEEKLDEKILLRSDGTSVYMTQDLGTAHQRFNEFDIDKHIYVVGNEQNYHFQVLKLILNKLGFDWSDKIFHLSYGMVELPEGKMKSREGTVVDADDLMDEMIDTAKQTTEELGKLQNFYEEDKQKVYELIGLGALKYFMLKVDPKKNMVFDPKESIDFNGNTGPFIQYSYTRIKSLFRKAEDAGLNEPVFAQLVNPNEKEIELIKLLYHFNAAILEAAEKLSPAVIANYAYDLSKEFNQYYHDYPILKERDGDIRGFRILLSLKIGEVLKKSFEILGITMPDRM